MLLLDDGCHRYCPSFCLCPSHLLRITRNIMVNWTLMRSYHLYHSTATVVEDNNMFCDVDRTTVVPPSFTSFGVVCDNNNATTAVCPFFVAMARDDCKTTIRKGCVTAGKERLQGVIVSRELLVGCIRELRRWRGGEVERWGWVTYRYVYFYSFDLQQHGYHFMVALCWRGLERIL